MLTQSREGMAERLAKRKRIRAGHKSLVTRILGQLDDLLGAADPASAVDVAKLTQLKFSLQEKLDTLKRLDKEIIDLLEEDKFEDEIQQADSFKEGIYSAMVKINQLSLTAPVPPSPCPTPHTDDPAHAHAAVELRGHRVKLPKLTLRAFNGDITTWTTFWDSYEAAIHKNSELSDIDKFKYLKSLLERTAQETITGLTLTSTNYHEAISILKKRFGNKKQIIARHMDILLSDFTAQFEGSPSPVQPR